MSISAPGNQGTPPVLSGGGSSFAGLIAPPKMLVVPGGVKTTNSLAAVMAGYGFLFTPTQTGKIKVSISGICTNTTPADGLVLQGAYGTGNPPANGAAAQGTLFGQQYLHNVFTAATGWEQFVCEDEITAPQLGVPIWVDLQLNASTGGTAEVGQCTFAAWEVS
jgi:hypothetical protein